MRTKFIIEIRSDFPLLSGIDSLIHTILIGNRLEVSSVERISEPEIKKPQIGVKPTEFWDEPSSHQHKLCPVCGVEVYNVMAETHRDYHMKERGY